MTFPLRFHQPSILIDGVDVSPYVGEVTVTGAGVAVAFGEIPPDLDTRLWDWFTVGAVVAMEIRSAEEPAVGCRFQAAPADVVQAVSPGRVLRWSLASPVEMLER